MSTLRVNTIQNTGNIDLITADSNGITTLKNQNPRVFVSGNQQAYVAQNANGQVPWNFVKEGNAAGIVAFNTSNGRFIAPIAGQYLVSVYTLIQTAAAHEWSIVKNGIIVTRCYTQNDRAISGTCIVTCSVNDYIAVQANSNSFYLHTTDTYSGMTIVFLG